MRRGPSLSAPCRWRFKTLGHARGFTSQSMDLHTVKVGVMHFGYFQKITIWHMLRADKTEAAGLAPRCHATTAQVTAICRISRPQCRV